MLLLPDWVLMGHRTKDVMSFEIFEVAGFPKNAGVKAPFKMLGFPFNERGQ